MEIKLGFNPHKLEKGSCLYNLFNSTMDVGMHNWSHSVGLTFWLLYKRDHITDQHFALGCCKLIGECEKNPIHTPIDLYRNVVKTKMFPYSFNYLPYDWIIKYWDYFNPNIRKKVRLRYKLGVDDSD